MIYFSQNQLNLLIQQKSVKTEISDKKPRKYAIEMLIMLEKI